VVNMDNNRFKNVKLFYHPIFLKHLEDAEHPERPERLKAIIAHLKETGVWKELQIEEPEAASEDWIFLNHSRQYIEWVKERCEHSPSFLDGGDTMVTEHSYEAALHAVGAALQAMDALMNKSVQATFCAVRPPGHHAEYDAAMGFCLFNNIAIAARYAKEKYGVKRIFILDWDVHHGNGTQHSFEDTDEVFYCSIHQWPLFPGTGKESERGRGRGEGFTLNFPLSPGKTDADYFELLETQILPVVREYRPKLFMISAGFDAHESDPLAGMRLSSQAYATMTTMIKETLASLNNVPLFSILEGGYHLKHLAESVLYHIEALGK